MKKGGLRPCRLPPDFFSATECTTTTPIPALATNENDILSRSLYYLAGEDASGLKRWMAEFKANGSLETPGATHDCFAAGRGDTAATLATIREYWDRYHYLLDPHTAVGVAVGSEFLDASAPPRAHRAQRNGFTPSAQGEPFGRLVSVPAVLVSPIGRSGAAHFSPANSLLAPCRRGLTPRPGDPKVRRGAFSSWGLRVLRKPIQFVTIRLRLCRFIHLS